MTRSSVVRAASAALLLAALPAILSAQEPEHPSRAAAPRLVLYPSIGLSLDQTPLTTKFAEVIPVALRLGVPVAREVEPWLGASVAHVRMDCNAGSTSCSKLEKRALLGLSYNPAVVGGAYVGGGLGVSSFRGTDRFAHMFVLGLAFPASRYLAPGIELRAENYQGFNELLMVSAVVRLSWPR